MKTKKTITRSIFLETILIFKVEFQSLKDDNVKDRKGHQEVNHVLLQIMKEIKHNEQPIHTSSNVVKGPNHPKSSKSQGFEKVAKSIY